jgi:hypothetical protein
MCVQVKEKYSIRVYDTIEILTVKEFHGKYVCEAVQIWLKFQQQTGFVMD